MEIIDESRFEAAEELMPELKEEAKVEKVTDENIEELMEKFSNPVNAQKEMAIKLKKFIDQRIDEELEQKGNLSDGTRRWIETYNSLMEKLQKAIHGEKSVNVNLTHVSHQDIANKIREANRYDID